jgi:hypothetical protein
MDDKYQKFYECLHKIYNLKNYNEVQMIINNYINISYNSTEKKLLGSLLYDARYPEKKIKPEKFTLYINIVENIKYKDDTDDLIEDMQKYTCDVAQINTIRRIIFNKPTKYNCLIDVKNNLKTKMSKNCPHCYQIHHGDSDLEYVICGYTNKGFDWKGCGYDWCFQCGKKLCKCCKFHAVKTNGIYPDDYCTCTNNYVNRDKTNKNMYFRHYK